MGAATPLVDAAGRKLGGGLDLRINNPRGQRKCKPDHFCDGYKGLITHSVNLAGNKIIAAVDAASNSIEATGILDDVASEVCVFNFCPNCGVRFQFPANK